MRWKLALAAIVCLVFVSTMEAEEIKGVVRKIDAPSRRLTLVVGDNAKTLSVAKDVSVVSQQPGDKKQPAISRPIAAGLAGLQVGDQVTLLTEAQAGKVVVTSIQLAQQANNAAPKANKKPATANKKPNSNKKAGQYQASNKKKGKTVPRRARRTEPERNLNRSLRQIEQGLQRIQ